MLITTEEFKKYLTDMHEIIDVPETNNAGVVSQFLVNAITEYEATLADAEKILREINSRVRLIGFPLDFFGDEFEAVLPESDKKYKCALWVGMNGPEELRDDIKRFGFEPGDIDISLEQTGFLIMVNKGG